VDGWVISAWCSPLLIPPKLRCNISMTLSLIRLVMAVQLTGHQDWMKSEVYRRKVDTQHELLDYIMDVFDHI
jgi:hypothetical protein